MTLTTQDHHALAHQVAAEWATLDPAATLVCVECGQRYPIIGPIGVPSIACPHCGAVWTEDCCRAALEGLETRRKREAAKRVESEPEQEQPAEDRGAPPGLDDVIGNAAAVLQIRTALEAHRGRCTGKARPVFPHVLLTGPGGTGKTMLSEIIAREVRRPIRLQMGQSLNNPSRVADVLLSLKAGDVLYIDECHGLKPICQEALYRAMEDGLLLPIAKAGSPVTPPIKLPPFTLIGSTTDEWGLLPSLLQRFKYRIRLERMTAAELAEAVSQRARRRGWCLTDEAAAMIGHRSHGTPRLALGLLDGCMDTATARGLGPVDSNIVQATCDIWGLDRLGLDRVERRYLAVLAAAGGPVKLNVIASQLDNLSRRTVEVRVEPVLLWLGLIEKRAEGRALTTAGIEHLKGQ